MAVSGENNTKSFKRAFNLAEAAQYIGVSRGTLNNWLACGLIPFEELPGRGKGLHRFRMVRKADLDAFLDKRYCSRDAVRKDSGTRGEIFLSPRV